MITELTPQQISQMSVYRDRWIEIGLCTEPADRPRAEKAINGMYQAAGLKPPQKIVWCGSPLANGMTRAIILNKKMASVRASVWASVRASVRDSVRDSVWASVRDSVWASVWASVRDSVWASVRDSVWASVRDSVWASVRESVWDSVWDSGYGQHDANWLAFYEYFRNVTGLEKETAKLVHHMEQAKSAGWYLPHANICWVSERPYILKRDERGRIHSTSGPSIAYPDGWKIYAVHGVRVPENIIENKESLTIVQIHAENNQEVRRVMLDLFGIERYFKEAKPKKIHADKYGTLYQKQYPDGDIVAFVHVKNSTPEPDGSHKDYFLFTDRECKTAHEAVAMSFGMTVDQYKPLMES